MKYIIIGLGNYGHMLAEELSVLGHEVIGADVSASRVDSIKEKIATAFVLDATDEQALAALPLSGVDVVIVAIGENFGASIRVVALLKQQKVAHIYARAIDNVHRSVLEAFGLERILTPEEDAARGLVHLLEFGSNMETFRVDTDYYVVKFAVPEKMIGYYANELNLDKEFSLKLLALKRAKTLKNCLGISFTEHDVMNELHQRGIESIGSDVLPEVTSIDAPYYSLDITDGVAVSAMLEKLKPDAVIHCAAWTAVDAAEDEDKQETVRKVNVEGTKNIAAECGALDIPMMYISTDYVFDGQGQTPWKPDCKEYAPLNVYGETKLAGELAVAEFASRFFIVRIAWVFGLNGNNFIKTMLKVGKTHDTLTVVDDQIGTPTYTYDLARLLVDMIQTDKYGYYHATNEGGYISWYDFAREIFAQAAALGHEEYDAAHLTVKPVTTAEYGASKAARPFNSRLDKSKLTEQGFTLLPTWQDALTRYLQEVL